MNKPRRLVIWMSWLLLAAVVGLAAWTGSRPQEAPAAPQRQSAPDLPSEGFARAAGPWNFRFPRDDGPHPEFQTEWWYFTGNLSGAGGQAYGYQLTIFRRGLVPPAQAVPRPSSWAADQVYFAHFTLSDITQGRFRYFEKFERGAAGLAGAAGEPKFEVWLDNWSVRQQGERTYRLEAQEDGLRLALDLTDLKGVVLQGTNGLSAKGPQAGNASYYTSRTRLASAGVLEVDGVQTAVQGSSWMDHEFSTSALEAGQVGWDWFALQLDDGAELMAFTLRRADGSHDAYSQALLVRADGSTQTYTANQFTIQASGKWKSPHTGAEYPNAWMVEIPQEGLSLTVRPRLADQELRVSVTYWEGAVTTSGSHQGKAVSGVGYVELTGYAGSMQERF